jgi:hypothetical protein
MFLLMSSESHPAGPPASAPAPSTPEALEARIEALACLDPVPRKTNRVDGWTGDVQRAFIVALASTGSARQAARAVGRATFGAERLREAPGSEAFNRAWDEAMALHRQEGSRRLAEGIAAVVEEAEERALAAGPWSSARARARLDRPVGPSARSPKKPRPRPQPLVPGEAVTAEKLMARMGLDDEQRDGLLVLMGIYRHILLKTGEERKARKAGRIAEADFYLRQVTWLEVGLDLLGGGGLEWLIAFKHDGLDLVEIAETPFSKLMERMRRKHWEECGDPPRPAPPRRELMQEKNGYAVEPTGDHRGGTKEAREAQKQAYRDQHERDAAEFIKWEAEARADWQRRASEEGATEG